jgi:integrase/recombinase XerD
MLIAKLLGTLPRAPSAKERLVPLHAEAAERLEAWLEAASIREDLRGALFRPSRSARGYGRTGFEPPPMTRRAVQKLVES